MNLPGCEDLKLVAGEKGLDREILWVSTVDNSDIVPYTNPGDFNFVTGVGANTKEELMKITVAAFERQLAGLVFCPNSPYLDEVPEEILAFGDEHDFPMFTIPWETKISDLSRIIGRYISVGQGSMRTLTSTLRAIFMGQESLPPDDDVKFILSAHRINLNGTFQTALFRIDPKNGEKDMAYRGMYDQTQKMLSKRFYQMGYIVPLDTGLAVLFRSDELTIDESALAAILIKEIEELRVCFPDFYFTLGIGSICEGIVGACESYHQAMLVIYAYSAERQEKTKIYSFDSLGSYKALYLSGNPKALISFSQEMLEPLYNYDATNDSELIRCLEVFFETGCHVKSTADQLFVHRNTVMYKFKKIEELIGKSMFTQDTLFDLQLALIIQRIYHLQG